MAKKKKNQNPLDAEPMQPGKGVQPEDTADTDPVTDAAEEAAGAADAIAEAAEGFTDGTDPEDSVPVDPEGENEKSSGGKKKKRVLTPEEEKTRAFNKVKRRKKLKYGTLATVITLVVLAIVVVANVICKVLDNRYNWNIDLTSSGLYEIDEKTADYLHKLNSDISVAVMADEQNFEENNTLKIISETLNRFKAEANGHISVEYVDMTKHPEAVSQYSEGYDGDLNLYDVVVRSAQGLVRVVNIDSLIKTEQTPNYQTMSYDKSYTFIGEQSLISAIMGVTDLNPVKVGVINKTNGQSIYYAYDEPGMQKMIELFKANNYEVQELDLATDSFTAAEYDLVVLCAPFNDPSEAQIQKLTDYLYNDGQYNADLVYFGSFNQQDTPNLDAFLALWGLKFENAVIMESNQSAAQVVSTVLGQVTGVPVAAVSDNALNAASTGAKLPVVAPFSLPIKLLFTDPNNGRETQALLSSPATSYLRPLDVKAEDFSESNAEKGSFAIGAIADNEVIVDNTAHTSRIVAFGTTFLLDYNVAASKSYGNADYFISVMNTVTGKEAVLTVAEKSLDLTTVTITDAQANAIRAVTVFIIPLLVAAAGIIVYVRRKNL